MTVITFFKLVLIIIIIICICAILLNIVKKTRKVGKMIVGLPS